MENGNWSLVFFTLLAQASAGTVILGTAYRLSGGGKLWTREKDRVISGASLLLLVTGLAFSFFHLGYPAHSVNAIRNLATSWMSREIICTMALIGSLLLWVIESVRKRTKTTLPIGNILSFVLSVALVYIMIRVYRIPAMTLSGSGAVNVSFISTTLFLGTAILWFTTMIRKSEVNRGLLYLGSIFLLSSFINLIITVSSNYASVVLQKPVIILYLLAIFPSITLFFEKHKNKWTTCGVIIMTLGIIAEIFNRYMILNISITGL